MNEVTEKTIVRTEEVQTLSNHVVVFAWDGTSLVKNNDTTVPVGDVPTEDGVTCVENRLFLHVTPPAVPSGALVQKVEVIFPRVPTAQGTSPRLGLYSVNEELNEGAFDPVTPVLLDYAGADENGTQYAFDITQWMQKEKTALNLMVKVMEDDLTEDTVVHLYTPCSAYTPKLVVSYVPAVPTEAAAHTLTHEMPRFGQGRIDLCRGNLTWDCEDFAWGGTRLPVTLKHRFNSLFTYEQYTAGSIEDLHVADFSEMKVGTGFALNVMQSVVQTADGNYHYVDDNGCDTVLFACTNTSGAVTHFADEDEVYTYTAADCRLKSGDETLTFDEAGRLVEIQDGYGNAQTITYEGGRITAVTDGAGRAFAFTYSATKHLTSITAPDGSRVSYSYTGDLLTHVYYPDGRCTEIQYGSRTPSAVLMTENMTDYIHKVQYDRTDDGYFTAVTEYGYDGTSLVQDTRTELHYDPFARCTDVTVENGDGTVHTAYHFDADGNVVGEYAYTVDEDGTVHHGAGDGTGVIDTVNRLHGHRFIDTAAWQMMTNDARTAVSCHGGYAAAPYGRNILRIDTQKATEVLAKNGVYQAVRLPRGEHTFSAYVHVMKPFTDEGAGAYLRVINENGTVLAQSEKLQKNEGWVRLSASFTLYAPTDVQVQLLADGTGMCHVNAPQLEDGGCATVYNYLENGHFPGTSNGWTGGTVTQNTLQLTAASVDAECFAWQEVKPRIGASVRETFTLSGWAKGVRLPEREHGGESPRFQLRAEVMYTDGIAPETFTADFAPAIGEWQYASVQFCKSRYASVRAVRVYCDYGFNEGTAYFANLQLVRDSLEKELSAEDFAVVDDTAVEEASVTETAQEVDTAPTFEEARDNFGNVLTETTFTDGEFGTVYRGFGFDETGNDMTTETDARGNVTAYTVNGVTSRNEEVTDRCGNKTAYAYDAAGRTTKVTSKNSEGEELAHVSYTYDKWDNLTAIARGDGMQYALGYNPFHNLETIGINGKSEKLVRYTYKNGNGRLKEITYANGDKMTATYNGQGQMVAEKWYNALNTLTAHYKYVYDHAGILVRSIDILAAKEYTYTYEEGKIVRATEAEVQLNGEMVVAKTVCNTLCYTYDAEGELIKKTVTPASGTAQTFRYKSTEDNAPVLTLTIGGKTLTSHSKTDAFGRKVFDEVQFGSGFVSRQFAYHLGKATATHTSEKLLKSTATTPLVSSILFSDGRTMAYEYDAEERITQVTDSVPNKAAVVTKYTYDPLGQLLTETVNGVTTKFAYDHYGNIFAKGVVDETGEIAEATKISYAYDDTWKDLLTSYNGQSITYDAQGNPTGYLGHALTWEKGRQLKSFDNIQYTYNANGIRTSKTVDGVCHEYTLDGTKILRETWDGHTLIPIYDNEDTVCGVVYDTRPYYFQKNLQGDVVAVVNANNDVVARYSYDAWGKCTVTFNASSITNVNPFRYRGYYYDVETGLYYVSSRYYDPEIGRFLNSDDVDYLGLGGIISNNLFVYCENNAVNNSDPDGYAPFLGWGVQLEGSFMGISGGIELVWYKSIAKSLYGNRNLPCVYGYGGFSYNFKSGNVWNIKSLIKYVKDTALRAFGSAKKAAWKIGGSLSLCAFLVYGTINHPQKYTGPFITTGATLFHIKAYYSRSPKGDVYCWGLGISSSKFGFSPLSVSGYAMVPANVIISIANWFSSLLGKIKSITNLI